MTGLLKRHPDLILILIAVPLITAALTLNAPVRWGGFFGDGAVYYAMADSLANDFDLLYTRGDLERINRRWPGGPQGILLVADDKHPEVIHYAKPVLYPMLAAPFSRFLHENGLLVFNALAFLFILHVGFRSFPDAGNDRKPVALWTLSFWGLTAVPAYIFTLTPDLFNGALVMGAMIPWIHRRSSEGDILMSRLILSAGLIGIAAAARPPNGLFILAPLYSFLLERPEGEPRLSVSIRRLRLLSLIILGFAAGAALVLLLTRASTGQFLAHGGFRKRIVGHMPFEAPGFTFLNTGNMISTRTTKFIFHWDTLWHNSFYFIFGRFAGLIPYFLPAAVTMLLWITPRQNSDDKRLYPINPPLVAITLGLILFHLVYIPTNYHGGSCAVGNRYLISFLPAFFLSLKKPPSLKIIFLTTFITVLLSGSIALNPIDSMFRYRDISKRSVLNRFPPEITLLNSWPVDDRRHVRVPFEGYFAYFADDNQWGKELDGFWIRGRSRASLVLRCWNPAPRFELEIKNGGKRNRINGHIGDAEFFLRMAPGESKTLRLKPGDPVIFYNLNGDPSYCYAVDIAASAGFIPRFSEPGNDDPRYLGCFVRIHPLRP